MGGYVLGVCLRRSLGSHEVRGYQSLEQTIIRAARG